MTYRRTTRTTLALALGLVVLAAACSDKQDVGQGVNTDLKSKLNELSTTTTVDPNATTTSAKVVGIDTTTPTTARAAASTTTTAPRQTTVTVDRAYEIRIYGDGSQAAKTQIDPNRNSVRVGTKVRFKNLDPAKVRSIVSVDGNFRSPDLPPNGGEWVYTASKPSSGAQNGEFHLVDGTRNYATATLAVVA